MQDQHNSHQSNSGGVGIFILFIVILLLIAGAAGMFYGSLKQEKPKDLADTTVESFDLMNDRLTHAVAFRKKDIGRYLSQEELLGILDALGMRHDGTMVMEKTDSGNVIYFMQAVDAEAA